MSNQLLTSAALTRETRESLIAYHIAEQEKAEQITYCLYILFNKALGGGDGRKKHKKTFLHIM